MNGKDDVVVFHRKNTEMINQNWCLPYWSYDPSCSLSPKEFLEEKLRNDFKIKDFKIVTAKEIEHTLFVVFKIKNLQVSCENDHYDQSEIRPWEIVRDYTDDNFFQVYNKLFVKIKKLKHKELFKSKAFSSRKCIPLIFWLMYPRPKNSLL